MRLRSGFCMSYWSNPGRRTTNNSNQFQNFRITMSGSTATTQPESFVIDPFAADINPGTTKGQKLFIEACAQVDEDKRVTASVEEQHKTMKLILSLVQRFRWGEQVLAVKLASDLTTTKSLLTESHALTIEDVKVQAYKIWGGGADAATAIPVNQTTQRRDLILTDITVTSTSTAAEKKIFYARVRSTMIRRAIEGQFSNKTIEAIRLHRKDYEWKSATGLIEEDGATMLKILVDIVKPSLKVGLKEFKDIISSANAKTYKNDPNEMLDAMENAYHEITVNRKSTYDQYMDDLFKALKTYTNRVYVDFVTRLEDEWETDASDDTPAKIDLFIQTVRTKYNNMKSRRKWEVVDPADAKILALSTQLQEVQQQLLDEKTKNLTSASAHATTTATTASKPTAKKGHFDTRRTKFVGPHTVIDGVAYDWCDKGHKSSASPDGMYMPEGHNHDEWLAKKLARRSQRSAPASADQVNSVKLALSEKLKACLMTKAGFSEEEAKALFDDVHLN